MKLPFRKNKEFLSALYDILGFYPHDINIYRIAFSHKSLSSYRETNAGNDRKARDRRSQSQDRTQKPLNNERLEYLGDAVLETVVSDILFRHFDHKREGFLTATRSKIVQRESLNRLAAEMGIERLIIAAQGTRMSHTNIGGNAFEALMGAIYLDRGYKYCLWFISNRVIGHYIDLDNVAQKEVNFKSKLLEWSQKNRININFKDTNIEGSDKGFSTVITLEGITISRGSGRSKKESQQEASKEALTRMRKDTKIYDSIFRSKEKRTAMEAEESFALPKIDEIENSLVKSKGKRTQREKAPVLEKAAPANPTSDANAAYDTAYDADAEFEVIDKGPEEKLPTREDYEAKGLPVPPSENDLEETPVVPDEKFKKKRLRNRGPKTVGDAVKAISKGESTPEEKAAKSAAELEAELKRQQEKAERKARAEAERKARQEAEKLKMEAEKLRQEAERKAREEAEKLDVEAETIARKEADDQPSEQLPEALTEPSESIPNTETTPVAEQSVPAAEEPEMPAYTHLFEVDKADEGFVIVRDVEFAGTLEEAEETVADAPEEGLVRLPDEDDDEALVAKEPDSEVVEEASETDDEALETEEEQASEEPENVLETPRQKMSDHPVIPRLRHISADEFADDIELQTAEGEIDFDALEAADEREKKRRGHSRRRGRRPGPKAEKEAGTDKVKEPEVPAENGANRVPDSEGKPVEKRSGNARKSRKDRTPASSEKPRTHAENSKQEASEAEESGDKTKAQKARRYARRRPQRVSKTPSQS